MEDREQELLDAVELPSPNKNFEIGLSTACNFDCPFCYNHANASYGYYPPKTIPRKVLESFILRNAPFQNFVLAVTGEPFLYPDMLEVVRFIHQHVHTINFSTNGSLLTPEIIDLLATCRMNFINVSVDGGGREYATLRRGGSLQKFKENTAYLAQKLGRKVYFAATVFNQNRNAVLKLPALAAEVGVQDIHFFSLNVHPKMVDRAIGNLSRRELEDFLPRLMDACGQCGVTPHWAPSFMAEDLNDAVLHYLGIDRHEDESGYRRFCYLPFERINVDPLGHINFCCYLEFIPGDALREPLAGWWNCRQVRVLRIMNLVRHFPEVCRVYCHKISSDDIPLDPDLLYQRCQPFRDATQAYLGTVKEKQCTHRS